MCSPHCLAFGRNNLVENEVKGRRVLEVGSYNVNGSLREYITSMTPAEYIGVDIKTGPGVDRVCDATNLVKEFGEGSFDLVVSTELLEHVADWKSVILNMKRVLKFNGIMLITTRSKGFPFHEYPIDAWRFELEDMQAIFTDFQIEKLEPDPFEPGVFIRARKPKSNKYMEVDLTGLALYSVPKDARVV